jgi:hypothetical protein
VVRGDILRRDTARLAAAAALEEAEEEEEAVEVKEPP